MKHRTPFVSLLLGAALFTGLSIFASFLSAPMFLILAALLTAGTFYIAWKRQGLIIRRRTMIGIIILVVSLRIAGEIALFLEVNSLPFRPGSKQDFVLRNLPFSLYVLGDLYLLEYEAERRFLAIRYAADDTVLCIPRPGVWDPLGLRQCLSIAAVDPFTGEPYLARGATLYSLGPDGRNHHGALSYDPLNGAFSSGDIVLDWLHPQHILGDGRN